MHLGTAQPDSQKGIELIVYYKGDVGVICLDPPFLLCYIQRSRVRNIDSHLLSYQSKEKLSQPHTSKTMKIKEKVNLTFDLLYRSREPPSRAEDP
jgi:hypothetical protein